ncbi:methyltransferase [Sphingobacterium corticis]|uniref:Methyltransferase n=1 Tax=Sphingobacterium corticis TaxID=1812823 RepID=A0ABW5NJL8_9SPHI
MKYVDKSIVLEAIRNSLSSELFVKATFGSYHGSDAELKNIYLKPILIKNQYHLSFTYRYARRDIVKNFSVEAAIDEILNCIEQTDFHSVSLFGQTSNNFFQFQKNKGWTFRTEEVSNVCAPSLSHNKVKDRKISDSKRPYLHALRLTDEEGNVFKKSQDKWKQINHYIELLSSELTNLSETKTLHIADMGAGKGYLTFALHDYLLQTKNQQIITTGVEYRKDLVDLCNTISADSKMDGLQFVEGTIDGYQPIADIDVLIALHACDTATDDAIFKGIQHNAQMIVVAPCCHKQVRRELEKSKVKNNLAFMTRHGIFLERHAEMLTDSIRALLLEYHGYQTKVMEFISDAHTPKNVLIIATKKTSISEAKKQQIKKELAELKSYFGLDVHHLELLLNSTGDWTN